MDTYLTHATSEDGTVVAFARDVRLGHLPTNSEVRAECLTVRDIAPPMVAELDQDLTTTGPGMAILLDTTTKGHHSAPSACPTTPEVILLDTSKRVEPDSG